MITYDSLSLEKESYDNTQVIRCLIICKKSTNLGAVEKGKLTLFRMMSKIIVKNIDNFFYLTRNHNKEIFHTKDDLISECFIVLHGCLRNFDRKRNKDFFWYFNKSLTRAMLRIVDRNYNKHLMVDRVQQNHEDFVFISSNNNGIDFIDFYLEKLNFTDDEKRVVNSKLMKEKVSDFLEQNIDITWNKYFKCLGDIKEKLKTLRDDQ